LEEAARDKGSSEEADGCEQRPEAQLLRVEGRDDDERHDVVDNEDREHERAQTVRKAGPDESASRPSAKAVSDDIAIAQPLADDPAALKRR
jgi:hypothetical protein